MEYGRNFATLFYFIFLWDGAINGNEIKMEVNRTNAGAEFCTRFISTCPLLGSPNAIPFTQGMKTFPMVVTFWPTSFLGISDLDQRFSMQGNFIFSWVLPDCIWTVNEPESTDSSNEETVKGNQKPTFCLVKRRHMWYPVVEHLNKVGKDSPFNSGDEYIRAICVGSATWQVSGQFDSACTMALKRFPFDKQTCSIHIAMHSTFDAALVEFTADMLLVNRAFSDTDTWSLDNYTVQVGEGAEVPEGDTVRLVPSVQFTFVLQRKAECYLGNIFVPMCTQILMQLSIFLMPATAPDRSGLSMTIFLASSFLLGIITQSIPLTPQLLYIVALFAAFSLLGVFVTIYSLIACRLAVDFDKVSSRRVAGTKLRLVDLVDLVAFSVTLLAYAVSMVAAFAYMAY